MTLEPDLLSLAKKDPVSSIPRALFQSLVEPPKSRELLAPRPPRPVGLGQCPARRAGPTPSPRRLRQVEGLRGLADAAIPDLDQAHRVGRALGRERSEFPPSHRWHLGRFRAIRGFRGSGGSSMRPPFKVRRRHLSHAGPSDISALSA
jgi:hypothetical protein